MTEIRQFRGQFQFLSNFEPAKVTLDGDQYETLEAAYQAAKTSNPRQRLPIRLAQSPGIAKKIGNDRTKVQLRSDWDNVKDEVMWDLLNQKFADPTNQQQLLDTGNMTIEEGNYWCDTYWGRCHCPKHTGQGENQLGHLLMKLRSSLRGDWI